jgi:hypothetical protein
MKQTHYDDVYPWDTRARQQSAKPYGFLEFAGDFFQVFQEKRQSHLEDLKQRYRDCDFLDPKARPAIQAQLRFPHYQDAELKRLAQQKADEQQVFPRDHLFPVYPLGALTTLEEFDAPQVINTLYEVFCSGKFNPEFMQHFQRVLKKVELRKLRGSYDVDFKNTSKDPIGLDSYGLFALTLAMHFSKTSGIGRYQSLSTLLKTNDHLLSEKENLSSPLELISTYTSVQAEQEFLKQVIEARGIQ